MIGAKDEAGKAVTGAITIAHYNERVKMARKKIAGVRLSILGKVVAEKRAHGIRRINCFNVKCCWRWASMKIVVANYHRHGDVRMFLAPDR